MKDGYFHRYGGGPGHIQHGERIRCQVAAAAAPWAAAR